MKTTFKKMLYIIFAALICGFLFYSYFFVQNNFLTQRNFEIKSAKLPSAFDGFRIVQISDLHNASFGKNNQHLLAKIKEAQPDIIAVTGDIIDSRRTDTAVAEQFVAQALKIAPVYYVTGNHEGRMSVTEDFCASVERLGVTLLRNKKVTLEAEGEKITLCGIDDPGFYTTYLFGEEEAIVNSELQTLQKDNGFNILLSHRPDYLKSYVRYGFDLVLCGHTHGGQIRLPFFGGLFAPGQGFFPEYDSGLYHKNGTSMLVSRGLGNSILPVRIHNCPEILLITLKKEVQ